MKKYVELYEQLKGDILAGHPACGQRIDSIRSCVRRSGLSQTTVEKAYERLADEGYIRSEPQKGWFVAIDERRIDLVKKMDAKPVPVKKYKYDLRPRSVHPASFDVGLWKKYLKDSLDDEQMAAYGDSQGELALRESLAHYAYESRRLITSAGHIIVGSSFQNLIFILCSLFDEPLTVGIEKGRGTQVRFLFEAFGWKVMNLEADEEGIKPDELKKDFDILYITSACQGTHDRPLTKRLENYEDLFIIEDDYNGELTYQSGPRNALCARYPDNIYMGSFSRVLVPGLRLAYMAVNDELINKFLQRSYGPSASKFEQLALARYIADGNLAKHVRKLNRLYRSRSDRIGQLFEHENIDARLNEAYLCFELEIDNVHSIEAHDIAVGINGNTVSASFASLDDDELEEAFCALISAIKKGT